MSKQVTSSSVLALACSILLQACGGGGGGSSSAPAPATSAPPPEATSSSVTTLGVITGFGSVFVNGVEYETDASTIESDDSVAAESDLKVGQIITLKGSVNADGVTGTADSIEYNDRVEGPITSISGDTLVVLGQTIIINGDTVFDDSVSTQSLGGLTAGDVIEVSGFVNGSGEIVATYVESNAPGGEFELVGIVSNLDIDNSTFDIGLQPIEFSGATFDDFDGAVIADDDQVEVKGSTLDVDGVLVAVKVELEEDDVAENDQLELEGLITGFVSATEFRIFTQDVTTTTATVFEGGIAEDLGNNIKVEVEGAINAVGILVATKVQLKAVEDTRFEATVDLVVVENDLNIHEVTVLGIVFSITDSTQLEDDREDAGISFGLENLVAGDFVEIRGKLQDDDGSVITTRLERDDLEDEVSVRGAVQSSNTSNFTLAIAGVSIKTTSETVYRDALEVSMTRDDFFAAAQAGVEVEAEGQETDVSEVTARELELEGD
jgi:hypothetical protein